MNLDFLTNTSNTLAAYMTLSQRIKENEDKYIQNPKYLCSEMIHILDEYEKNK